MRMNTAKTNPLSFTAGLVYSMDITVDLMFLSCALHLRRTFLKIHE